MAKELAAAAAKHGVGDTSATPLMGVPLYPRRATAGSAGFDLMAVLTESVTLGVGERLLVPTGIFLRMPPHMVADVRPRSGLALKQGLTVLNSPGTIDSDYRGEVGVILINHGQAPTTITPAMRIAQLVFLSLPTVDLVEVVDIADQDGPNSRGTGGFGSTAI